jgi:hypothetical protein
MNLKQLNCEHCIIGKLSTTPFPSDGVHRASRTGELVHSDVYTWWY